MNANLSRRRVIFGASVAASLGALAWARSATTQSLRSDYRALVCIFLNGGNDGNNTLIPLDAGYQDYIKSRGSLALSSSELLKLNSVRAEQSFGLHPACGELAALYHQQRLAFIANVGPLFQPTTTAQVLNGTAQLPPALFSHSDQTNVLQGWQGDEDQSGWAGRALDSTKLEVGDAIKGISNSMSSVLVRGQNYAPAFASINGDTNWGAASLTNSNDPVYRALLDLASPQANDNPYQVEYARTLSASLRQASELARALALSKEPTAPFGSSSLDEMLRYLAKLLPVFKQSGYQRQVFFVDWGAFDTHTDQRGSNALSQDSQLAVVSKAMGSFQAALDVAGLSENVTTFMMTEFSRTLMPATSNGSDHAWGNHFWVMGGRVRGGTVYGQFPNLVLGGKDDCDDEKEGRFVPTIATDQYGATLLNWLGISSQGIARAFPNLGNFPIKDLGFMA
jgi:uncharacterized protein (DUF1501 family)